MLPLTAQCQVGCLTATTAAATFEVSFLLSQVALCVGYKNISIAYFTGGQEISNNIIV